jgi:hypothetical protein
VKLKVALLSLVAVLTFSATAAAYYYVPFGQARKISKIWVRGACEARGPSCIYWKVGHCARISEQRVDCAALIELRPETCVFIVENRVGEYGSGRIHQRRRHLRCFAH